MYVWNRDYGDGHGSIYVDDRPKSFSPVGYTSTVDFSNESGTDVVVQDDGYEIYPEFKWFYYSDLLKKYVELNYLSTFENPEPKIPHYHRTHFAGTSNLDLWCVVEVGKQTAEIPSADYVAVDVKVVRSAVDENGDIVLGIPFEMRDVSTPNNETLVYSIAYYAMEVSKTVNDSNFPENSLNGKHILYVRP